MESIDEQEEPIPLSRPSSPPPVATPSAATERRKRWSSAPPPPMPRRRNRVAMTLFGAVWVAIGVASAAYVVQRAHDSIRAGQPLENVATTEAR
jgi:hypothetical protein